MEQGGVLHWCWYLSDSCLEESALRYRVSALGKASVFVWRMKYLAIWIPKIQIMEDHTRRLDRLTGPTLSTECSPSDSKFLLRLYPHIVWQTVHTEFC
jgi:hypothetical protein